MNVPPNEVPPNDAAASSPPAPPPPPAQPPIAAEPIGIGPSAEEKQWALFAHLSALVGGILTGHMLGWGCFIGPLIIWLVKKDSLPFVNDQGKEALNFNITAAIIGIGLLVLSVPLTLVTLGLWLIIAIPVAILFGIGWLVLIILASIKASEGVAYRYPIALRLIK